MFVFDAVVCIAGNFLNNIMITGINAVGAGRLTVRILTLGMCNIIYNISKNYRASFLRTNGLVRVNLNV